MTKTKLSLIIIINLLFFKTINAQNSFNKKFFIGAGGQLSVYEESRTGIDFLQDSKYAIKNYITNYGVNAEIGYFVLPNLSVSLKSTFQEWGMVTNTGTSISKSTINSIHNGILFNKMFPIKENLFFSAGIMPFYEKIFFTPSQALQWPSNEKSETRVNHGALFNIGFDLAIEKNSIISLSLYNKFDALPSVEDSKKSGLLVSYKYIFNNSKEKDVLPSDNTINTQKKQKFNLLIGANINNPHQLFEGINSYTDYSSFRYSNLNSYGNLFIALLYKNKLQLTLCQELNEKYNIYSNGVDYSVHLRYYLLNEGFYLNPYIETGTIIGSIKDVDLKNQKSIQFSSGFIYKINRLINLDLGLSLLHHEYAPSSIQPARSPFGIENEISYNRFMVKTGLIFKIL